MNGTAFFVRHWPFLFAALMLGGCQTAERTFVPRTGDEIIVAGRLFHTGTRVITWMDPGGYDAYRVERRFASFDESDWTSTQAATREITSPNRYGLRDAANLPPEMLERVRGGGWTLPELQEKVDQFVVHYDACGLSRICFDVLHDQRGLSVHFLLDLDGTIYQTLDLKERAFHATTSNSRSIGVEIAHIGAFPPGEAAVLDPWYRRDEAGNVALTIPARVGDPALHVRDFRGRPARSGLIRGRVQAQELVQYDFTPEQYAALIKLTAALCTIFPKIRPDYPRQPDGTPFPAKLADDRLASFQGILGHYHIQENKTDPGPAFQWDRLIAGARALLGVPSNK